MLLYDRKEIIQLNCKRTRVIMSGKFLFFSICISLTIFAYVNCKERFYKTYYIDVPLDHFSFSKNVTFKMRYLMNNTYWDKENGPVFFYTGNEGDIEVFAKHTGFIWDSAKEFNALIIFAEHRYYGKSLPFGNKSLSKENVGYLTSSQAMADYIDLIYFLLKDKPDNEKNSVIAIGGSYGGMLSAYIRMKYPHIITGAIAASAPILQFKDLTACDAFYRIVSSAFSSAGRYCSDNIKKSWPIIRNKLSNQEGQKWFFNQFKICNNSKDIQDVAKTVVNWLIDIYTNLAMVNYPYANDFLAPLPAYPIAATCQYINYANLTGEPLLKALYSAISVYTNFTGKTKCNNIDGSSDNGLDTTGWDYQACTEMVMPMCTTGIYDMFENAPWNQDQFTADCKKKYGVEPAYHLAMKEYGGKKLKYSSNIVFSNGLLDPWASGGVFRNYSNNIAVVIIPEGAHHLDLMGENPQDPYSVTIARQFHKQMINEWIQNDAY